MLALESGSEMGHSSPENIDFGLHEVDETCPTALLNFPAVRSLRRKSVRLGFPHDTTQWTRWEVVALGLATLNGQQERVSCFPTLLRNDLNLSDVVHFTTHDSSLSCNKSGFCKLCTACGCRLPIGK